jgi:hypothetical protein
VSGGQAGADDEADGAFEFAPSRLSQAGAAKVNTFRSNLERIEVSNGLMFVFIVQKLSDSFEINSL